MDAVTKKLYYVDSYQSEFVGCVQLCKMCDKGYEVVLDQTAFYPGGGGQPKDLGMLGGMDVVDVYEKDEVIYHVVDKPLEVGTEVEGSVFIEKRRDYMIQHSGEHILSGIIHKWFGYRNVGFYVNDTYMTADFDGELTKEQCDMIELKANEAVVENVPICATFYPSSQQAPAYRSKLNFDGEVRVVDIKGYDVCACCGTHPSRSGEIGLIKIVNYERHRGGCRLTILCGRRALYDYQEKSRQLSEVSAQLSVPIGKITEGVAHLKEEFNEQKIGCLTQTHRYLELKAHLYPKDRPLCIIEEGLSPNEMKIFADALAKTKRETTLVVVPTGPDFRYIILSEKEDVRPFCKAFNQAFQGKGGGKAHLCQGSGSGCRDEVEAYFYSHFKSWVKEIEAYQPFNEQEAQDQKVFLDYIHRFDNTLDRSNEVAHVTSSSWIVNKTRDKVLMAHHHIYNAWAWTGGHNDGVCHMLEVAIREAEEETGITQLRVVDENIFSIDVLPVKGHVKKGKYVTPHLHLSVAYLLEGDETLALRIKEDENSGVKWIPVDEMAKYTVNEPDMQLLYDKFMKKIKAKNL